MTGAAGETRSVVVERQIAHAPEKIWRALTQPHLIAEWLMQNDFLPRADHAFKLRTSWGSIDCRVLEIEPHSMLAYRWDARGLESVVTWTLTPTPEGTLLRMEQRGFRPDQIEARKGATAGWHRFLGRLEELLARTD